jgi:hypothetical protein
MDRRNIWMVAGSMLLGMMLLSLAQAFAQRNFRTEPGSRESGTAHYQVVNVTEGEIIIMDTTTGDLYSAKPRDVKPYETRLRPTQSREPLRPEFKDKDGFRKKAEDFKDRFPDTRKDL